MGPNGDAVIIGQDYKLYGWAGNAWKILGDSLVSDVAYSPAGLLYKVDRASRKVFKQSTEQTEECVNDPVAYLSRVKLLGRLLIAGISIAVLLLFFVPIILFFCKKKLQSKPQ